MSRRSNLPRGLPRRCECGGRMLYDFDFGRVWSACDTCTPVVHVDISKIMLGMPRSR